MVAIDKNLDSIQLTSQAITILNERYLQRDKHGNINETPEEMFYRVAECVASAETQYCGCELCKEQNDTSCSKVLEWTDKFYEIMSSLKFLPNTPCLMNAGTNNGMGFNGCYVLPIEDSLDSIYDTLKTQAFIHRGGGGTGFSFSKLRPEGSMVKSTHGVSSGPVSFLKVYDASTQQIKQGGRRRGANMGILSVDHPDIVKFITCKLDGGITNFNISVAITDEFMKAVKSYGAYKLIDPRTGNGWNESDDAIADRLNYKVGWHRKDSEIYLYAKDVFDLIAECAWECGDPGMFFVDTVNNSLSNPVPKLGPIIACNPCGEQSLYSYDMCNLGSINLAKFVKSKCTDHLDCSTNDDLIDWDSLKEVIRTGVRFLDNVIDVTPYEHLEIEKTAKNIRRIGLGVMGWADMLMMLGIPYNSNEALLLAERIAWLLKLESHTTSQLLAEEKGSFPYWEDSIWNKTIVPGTPMRNSSITMIAPTGTISLIANCSSGIEPMFALVYEHYGLEGKIKEFITCNPFMDYLNSIMEQGAIDIFVKAIYENKGSCQGMGLGDKEKIFVTARDIDWESHVKQQMIWQEHIDNGISKTINMPSNATVEDIKNAYMMAWEGYCKGITIFRDGSKDGILSAGTKDEIIVEKHDDVGPSELIFNNVVVQYNSIGSIPNFPSPVERPDALQAVSIKQQTSYGNMYLNISEISPGQPLEVFITLGKSGNEFQALCELLGRMFSMWLKTAPEGQRDKALKDIITQSLGIGSVLANGIGENKIYSISDAIGKGLQKYFFNRPLDNVPMVSLGIINIPNSKPDNLPVCPDCGASSMVNEEGCQKCYSCGYSRC